MAPIAVPIALGTSARTSSPRAEILQTRALQGIGGEGGRSPMLQLSFVGDQIRWVGGGD
jgi:hypothetical protein